MLTQSAVFIILKIIQSFLYGLYLATFVHCLRWLIYDDEGWRLKPNINWPILTITVFVFLLTTIDLALSLPMTVMTANRERQIFAWSIFDCLNFADGPISMLVVDAVLIYRCWQVYGRSWRIVCFPLMLWTGCFIAMVLELVHGIHSVERQQQQTVTGAFTLMFVIAFYAGSITINLYATPAIIYRIVRVAQNSTNGPGRLYKTCRIIIESGLLYTLSTFGYAMAYIGMVSTMHDNSVPFALLVANINFSMPGVAFNLILIRIHEERSTSHDTHADTGFQNQENARSTVNFHVADVVTEETEQSISEISAAESGPGGKVVQRHTG